MVNELQDVVNIDLNEEIIDFIKEKYHFFDIDEAISRFIQITLYDLFMDLQPLDIKFPVLKDDPSTSFKVSKLILSEDLVGSIMKIFNNRYSHSFDRFQLELRKQLYMQFRQYEKFAEIIMLAE